jgi:tetratricopeptide (TPR) repeat protein
MKKIFLIIFCFSASYASAQLVQTTETEVKLQGKMIDASWAFVATQYEKAEKMYIEIIDKTPKNAAAHYELARTYCAQKLYDKAIQSAKQAVDLEKSNTWYKLLLGDIFQHQGKFKEAAVLYEALTKLEPHNADFYFAWAECLALNGEKQKAIKAFENLEKKTGFDEDIHRQKHILYLELGDTKKAEKELQKMIDNEPTNTEFYHVLAGFYKQIGDNAKELEVYQRIVSMSPSDERANVALLNINRTQKQNAAGSTNLKTLFENRGISLDTKVKELIPIINKVAETNDGTMANAGIELVKILETQYPEDAKVYAIYGDFLYHSKRKKEALAMYEKTIKINPNVFSVWENRFDIQYELQEYDALAKSTENALDYFPNQANVHYFMGLAHIAKQKYDDATAAFEQVLMMSGKSSLLKTKGNTGLAKVQVKLKKLDAAKQYLTKVEALGADNFPDWLETTGDVAALNNDLNTAISFWQKAKEKGANSEVLNKKISDRKYE